MFNIVGSYYFHEEKDLQAKQWKKYKTATPNFCETV